MTGGIYMTDERFIKKFVEKAEFLLEDTAIEMQEDYEKEISVSNEEWKVLSNKGNTDRSFFSDDNNKSEDLKIAVEKLTEKQKEVIILYYYKNKKIKVIAEEMNMNENAVKQLKLRAISKLKSYLEGRNEK